jgi:uncharacterized protein YndB with AHSA1/START domain
MAATSPIEAEYALEITRSFDAPPALVFKAWTSKEHVLRWWRPKNFTATSEKLDFRVGGAYRHVIHAQDGTSSGMSGIYREIVEPERVVFTFAWDDGPETLITVTIKPEGNGTKLTFRHEPFADAASRDSHEGGWSECLDRLVAEMARQPGTRA